MGDTAIGWTGKTWNPVVGCSRVSPGCEHCYAEEMAARIERMGRVPRYKGLTVFDRDGRSKWNGEVREAPEVLDAPLHWREPQTVFVNSMSDLFHEKLPFEYIAAVFGVMASCPRHTFQVLTKRAKRMPEFFRWLGERDPGRKCGDAAEAAGARVYVKGRGGRSPWNDYSTRWPLPNVHLGVSVEDQTRADKRIPYLLASPAAIRFISAEPLLYQLDLRHYLSCIGRDDAGPWLDWVIVGGESGKGYRAVDPAYIDSVVIQCVAAGKPVFVKQDSGPKPGKQGRLSAATWAHKEFPR